MAEFEGAFMQVFAQVFTKDYCWGKGELSPR